MSTQIKCPACGGESGFTEAEFTFKGLGVEEKCVACGVVLRISGEDTEEGFSFWLEPVSEEARLDPSAVTTPSALSTTEMLEFGHLHDSKQLPDIIHPGSVYLAIPCGDGRLMSELAGSLVQCVGLYGAFSAPAECSDVSLVRNLIASQFLATPFEWLVCVDNDIRFTREDLLLLLQPKDLEATYVAPGTDYTLISGEGVPTPTRIDTATLSGTRTMADVVVKAEYPYKNDTLEPIKNGMGFVRIHRSVFRTLETLKHDHGTVNVPGELWDELMSLTRPDEGGQSTPGDYYRRLLEKISPQVEDTRGAPRLFNCSFQGRQFYDFFPNGPLLSQFIPHQQWKGEDHGFFTLCMLAGIIPREETRTRLVHIGRKAYQYPGPDVGAGQ